MPCHLAFKLARLSPIWAGWCPCCSTLLAYLTLYTYGPYCVMMTELREGLYGQSTSLPYRVTACQLNATPLYVSSTR